MTLPPLGKTLLAVTVPLLLSGTVHANTSFIDDLQLLGNDRYVQTGLSAADFMDIAPARPQPPRQSVNIPANTFSMTPSLRTGLSHAARYLKTQNRYLGVLIKSL